ncbi:MAG: biopolymer transporter ExbD [Desulfovibrio sp.]|jgi:biopolymer transport protein ExbD|nr:biopolymer transporter ExbD [Desulfovibrio sp.]
MHNYLSFEEEPEASLDLTPLIDTVFMLLIFFIMATTFSKPVLEVALATADSAGVREAVKEKLVVTITAEGFILFDDEPVREEEVASRMAPLPREAPLVFNVDKGAPFGLFVQVLNVAKGQQRSRFVINASHREAQRDDGADKNE